MKKVTGIGGIFFKCDDPKMIKAWYAQNLGIDTNEYGATFEWMQSDGNKKGSTQWTPFESATKYFDPSAKEFMINYRVDNIEELVNQLRLAGVIILDEIASYEYGKFVHVLDPENNKIELWEPVMNK